MTAITADFEKGTNGNTVATSDAGSATAWNYIQGSPKYDNTHVAHGLLAEKASSGDRPTWITAFGTPTSDYGRMYIYLTAFTANSFLMRYSNNASPPASSYFSLNLSGTSGLMKLENFGTVIATFSTPLTANQFCRVEWNAVYSTGGSGKFEVKLFLAADSITADQTQTVTSITTPVANAAAWEPLTTNGTTVWYDQLVAAATAYPGPFPVSTTAPVASGSTTIGSTISCTNGVWNSGGTFTYTYQWQRDVLGNGIYSNISGAAASTYTLSALDDLCNVRCVVTATGIQATNESATANSNSILDTSAPSGFMMFMNRK